MAARGTRAKRPLVLFFGTLAVLVAALTVAWIIDFRAFLGLLVAVTVGVAVMWLIARTGRPGRARSLQTRSRLR